MSNTASNNKKLSIRKIWIPVIIGLGITAFLLYNTLSNSSSVPNTNGNYAWVDANKNKILDASELKPYDATEHKNLERYDIKKNNEIIGATQFTFRMALFLFIALILVALRDVGYMWRLRILTDYKLSWRRCFRSILLWEFSSAVTPSVVGGSGVAIFILNREGLKLGHSSAVVMVTALLDELFYIIMVPLVIAFVGLEHLFPVNIEKVFFGIKLNTEALFWVGYGFICLLTISILLAIFFFPQSLRNVLIRLFSLPILRRWRMKVAKAGDDIVITSAQMKDKPISFWAKSMLATFLSWTSRYWVVNFLILAFGPLNDHFMVYARQLVMWVIMLISPTPGGAGIAEVAFTGFLAEYTPIGFVAIMAILWRLFTYYPYLIAGAIILPSWLKKRGKSSN